MSSGSLDLNFDRNLPIRKKMVILLEIGHIRLTAAVTFVNLKGLVKII